MATEQQQPTGVIDATIDSAKSGVNAAKTVLTEGIGVGGDVVGTAFSLGKEYTRLVQEGGTITVGQGFDLINHILERIHNTL